MSGKKYFERTIIDGAYTTGDTLVAVQSGTKKQSDYEYKQKENKK